MSEPSSTGRSQSETQSPSSREEPSDEEYPPMPWHFKLMLVALVLYLLYRFVELVVWLVGRYL